MLTKKVYLDENYDNVCLDVYVAEEMDNFVRDAILILPGGGYKNLSPREGEPVALAFMAQGYNAFVLKYSVNLQKTFPGQLIEASLAMAHIKAHAKEYNINPDRVFVTGFSAGGHLAASLGILWHDKEVYEAAGLKYGENRPAGMMVCYPVISTEPGIGHFCLHTYLCGTDNPSEELNHKISLEKQVDENSVPMFLMHTANDKVASVRNTLVLADAYAKIGKSFELHIYPDAAHGAALANPITSSDRGSEWNRPQVERWIKDAVIWAETVQ